MAPPAGLVNSTFQPGEIVAQRFRVCRLIAAGGMGEVYLAEDCDLATSVALKTLLPGTADEKGRMARFLREVRLARQVTHQNVCRVFDIFHHEVRRPAVRRPAVQRPAVRRPARALERPVIAVLSMEFLDGESLEERLQRRSRLPTEEALPIVAQIAAALAAAHEVGIVHCDLKASNVMIVEATGGERAVVTDFGLAMVDPLMCDLEIARAPFLAPGEARKITGTPAYMAPEQVLRRSITKATDVYALGVLIYRMVTGELPFLGRTAQATARLRLHEDPRPPREIVPALDPCWNETILECLERSPANRLASSLDVVDALRSA